MVAKRRVGMRSSMSCRTSGSASIFSRDGVSTVVGAMAFTRMPCSAHSIASIRVMCETPALEMPYRAPGNADDAVRGGQADDRARPPALEAIAAEALRHEEGAAQICVEDIRPPGTRYVVPCIMHFQAEH